MKPLFESITRPLNPPRFDTSGPTERVVLPGETSYLADPPRACPPTQDREKVKLLPPREKENADKLKEPKDIKSNQNPPS